MAKRKKAKEKKNKQQNKTTIHQTLH